MLIPPPRPEATLAILLGAKDWPHCEVLKGWNGDICVRSCARVRDYLLDPGGLALPPANLLDLFDDPDPLSKVCAKITAFLKGREGASPRPTDLLVYYVGHGDKDSSGTYYLLLRSSRASTLKSSGLSLDGLAELLKEDARHLRQYLILDACMSGRARYADWQSPQGVAVLCSSSPRLNSRAPLGETFTLFTGALVQALTQPVSGHDTRPGSRMSLMEVWRRADTRIRKFADKKVLPLVYSYNQGVDDLADLPLFPCPLAISAEQENELLRHNVQVHERRETELLKEAEAAKRRQQRVLFVVGSVMIGLALLAWKVWPTPYAPYRDESGHVDPGARVNRLSGNLEVFDTEARVWQATSESDYLFQQDKTKLMGIGFLGLSIETEKDPAKKARLCNLLKEEIGQLRNPFLRKLHVKEFAKICGEGEKP